MSLYHVTFKTYSQRGLFAGVKLVEGKVKLPSLDDEFEERCAAVRRDCIQTGEIFRRNVVCSSNFKRYLNTCHLQLRSCDLHRDIGELLAVERCWWIEVPDGETIVIYTDFQVNLRSQF